MDTATEPVKERKWRLTEDEEKKICKLRETNNLSIGEIAAIVSRDPSTVFRVLDRAKPDNEELQVFKRNETSVLALKRLLRSKAQIRILDSLNSMDEEEFSQLTPMEKANIDKALSISSGVETDKQLDLQKANISITFNYFDSAQKMDEISKRLASLGIDAGSVIEQAESEPKNAKIIGNDE